MTTRVDLSRQTEKDLKKIPQHIKIKLLSWVEAVEKDGLEKVRKIPGYHDEPLKGQRVGQRSIRLSLIYRAIYEVRSDGFPRIIEVQEVTKHEYWGEKNSGIPSGNPDPGPALDVHSSRRGDESDRICPENPHFKIASLRH